MLSLAVPSDGPLHETALIFLKSCGLGVLRNNLRRYTAEIPSFPGVTVHFQRGADIALEVEEGIADMGIVGKDRFLENIREGGTTKVILEKLGFGHSQLVIGVPDSWVDIVSLSDLADLSIELRGQEKDLRIATKYPKSSEQFLLRNGVTYFSLIPASGTLEAAPAMGYADIIAEITSTGTTLRENHLKPIRGGTILTSQACLITNVDVVKTTSGKFALATSVVERIEAHLRANQFYSITSNVKGESPEQVAEYVLQEVDISGLRGPTVSKVYARDGEGWYSVTVIMEKNKLLDAVQRFRQLGGVSVTVSQLEYVFDSQQNASSKLIDAV